MNREWMSGTTMGMAAPPSGERIYALKSAQRLGRVNRIVGDRNQQLIAPFTITGACNRVVFEIWLETCLIPTLRARDWVVIDTATFHHGGRIAELIDAADCKVIYLPPYSPDLNRIEKCWAWLKNRIRKQLRNSDDLRHAMETVLKQATS